MQSFRFRDERSHEERLEESGRVATKYPDKVPLICEMAPTGRLPVGIDIKDIKTKYLVNKRMTLGEFSGILRKKMKLAGETAIFIFVNNQLPSLSNTIGVLQSRYEHTDGFLYLHYNFENVFG